MFLKIFLCCLFVIIIGLILVIFLTMKEQYHNNENIDIFCISLKENEDRKEHIKKYFKGTKFINAINTKGEKWKNYKNHLTENAIIQLEESKKTKRRKEHYELMPGAVGCFLSHLKTYKHILENPNLNSNIFLILEDDAIPKLGFSNKIKKILTNLPEDFDILLLGCKVFDNDTKKIKVNQEEYLKLNGEKVYYFQSHCYLISLKGIHKILKEIEKQNNKFYQQHDLFLSDLVRKKKINIYYLKRSIAAQAQFQFPTNIQIYPKK